MNVREALAAMSAAEGALIAAFDDFDPRDSFEDMTDRWWCIEDGHVVTGDDLETVKWGRAYRRGNDDPILNQPEPGWGDAPIVRDVTTNPSGAGFTAVTIDNQDGHGYSTWILDDAKRVPEDRGSRARR